MLIEDIEEHEDGATTVKFDLTHEEVQVLLAYALKRIFTEAAKKVVDV